MKVVAVLVTYKSNLTILKKVIESLENQVECIVIVNNGNETIDFSGNIEMINLHDNFGIATAQNIGIKKALAMDCDYILLSDQDTIYPKHYVTELLKGFDNYDLLEIASIAPVYYNVTNNTKSFFYEVNNKKLKKSIYEHGTHEVLYTISSGQIIPIKVFDKIGFMREELFIDWVDIDWCIRAHNAGLKNLQNANVVIEHHLGDSDSSISKFKIIKHSEVRNRYLIRNGVYLSKEKNFPFYQRQIIKRILIRNIIGILVTYRKNFFRQIIIILNSIWLGEKKIMGKIYE